MRFVAVAEARRRGPNVEQRAADIPLIAQIREHAWCWSKGALLRCQRREPS